MAHTAREYSVFDFVAASGSVFGLGDYWRFKNSVANATALGASVDGYVTSTQGVSIRCS
jgi:hypothetical protein